MPATSRSETALRRCARCGQNAVHVERITRHRMGLVPSGSSYDHRCSSCHRKFATVSTWRAIVLGTVLFSLLGPTGVLLVLEMPKLLFASGSTHGDPSVAWGSFAMLLILDLLLAGAAAWVGLCLYRRFENPVAPAAQR